MKNELKQELVDRYNAVLADIIERNIKLLEFGIVEAECSINIFPILINSIQNIEIFTDVQCNNIHNYINKLIYGQQ